VHTADGESFEARVAVIAAGAWAGSLLAGVGIHVPLRPNLEQSTYFSLDADPPLPTVIDWLEDPAHPRYLVPDPWAPGSFKVGLHMAGPETDPETRSFEPDPVRVDRVVDYVTAHVPGAEPTDRTDTCLYTITPDEDFVLDRVGPIVVASPCSGHGFKFVPLFGRALADLALGVEPSFDRSPFRVDRPALARR
jgi:sarcosine oxidase